VGGGVRGIGHLRAVDGVSGAETGCRRVTSAVRIPLSSMPPSTALWLRRGTTVCQNGAVCTHRRQQMTTRTPARQPFVAAKPHLPQGTSATISSSSNLHAKTVRRQAIATFRQLTRADVASAE